MKGFTVLLTVILTASAGFGRVPVEGDATNITCVTQCAAKVWMGTSYGDVYWEDITWTGGAVGVTIYRPGKRDVLHNYDSLYVTSILPLKVNEALIGYQNGMLRHVQINSTKLIVEDLMAYRSYFIRESGDTVNYPLYFRQSNISYVTKIDCTYYAGTHNGLFSFNCNRYFNVSKNITGIDYFNYGTSSQPIGIVKGSENELLVANSVKRVDGIHSCIFSIKEKKTITKYREIPERPLRLVKKQGRIFLITEKGIYEIGPNASIEKMGFLPDNIQINDGDFNEGIFYLATENGAIKIQEGVLSNPYTYINNTKTQMIGMPFDAVSVDKDGHSFFCDRQGNLHAPRILVYGASLTTQGNSDYVVRGELGITLDASGYWRINTPTYFKENDNFDIIDNVYTINPVTTIRISKIEEHTNKIYDLSGRVVGGSSRKIFVQRGRVINASIFN